MLSAVKIFGDFPDAWCIPGVSARIWFGSGIPPALSVVGIRSALSPLLWFSAPVGIRVQPVLQHISERED